MIPIRHVSRQPAAEEKTEKGVVVLHGYIVGIDSSQRSPNLIPNGTRRASAEPLPRRLLAPSLALSPQECDPAGESPRHKNLP